MTDLSSRYNSAESAATAAEMAEIIDNQAARLRQYEEGEKGMLIIVSGKQDPQYAIWLALAEKLRQRKHEQRTTTFLDELFGDDDFEDRYVKYKRQVDIVNNHNDDLEDIQRLIKTLPMPGASRTTILNYIDDQSWPLPEEPTKGE